jgi:CO/xanthine dehydrogenase FAD-binding subunit
LKRIDEADGVLHIGAGASLEDAWAALVQRLPDLRELWLRFASPPVRHAGTMGGNLANGSPIGDTAPVLLALGASAALRRGRLERTLPLDGFYTGYMQNQRRPGELLVDIEVPLPGRHPAARLQAEQALRLRHLGPGLRAGLTLDGDSVTDARFAFGGLAAMPRRAPAPEAAVRGRAWTQATVHAAAAALARTSTDDRPARQQRLPAAFGPGPAAALLARDPAAGPAAAERNPRLGKPGVNPPRESAAIAQVGQPQPHESAHLHVRGEAPTPTTSPRSPAPCTPRSACRRWPMAVCSASTWTPACAPSPAWWRCFSAADLPGRNDCGPIVHDDPILADGSLHYLGQPVFLVVATQRDLARRAAALAREVITAERCRRC